MTLMFDENETQARELPREHVYSITVMYAGQDTPGQYLAVFDVVLHSAPNEQGGGLLALTWLNNDGDYNELVFPGEPPLGVRVVIEEAMNVEELRNRTIRRRGGSTYI